MEKKLIKFHLFLENKFLPKADQQESNLQI